MKQKTMLTGAAYIRVSTDKQEELSPDAQKRLILDYAAKNGIEVSPSDIYLENGISGRNASKRPAFLEMIARAKTKEHPFDVILVWKYSRFARNQEESIVYKSMLKKDHVEVISISEPMIDGPFGTLIERIIEWMDEYYSIRLSDEVMRGMTEKAMRGGYQSAPPFGYIQTGHNNPPAIHPEQATVVRRIFASFSEGKTCYQIARSLNELGVTTANGNPFETRTVKYIIENPFYCGNIRWNYTRRGQKLKSPEEWILAPGRHEPLVSKEEWENAQKRIAALRQSSGRRDAASCKHWLSGILKCSSCGASLGYHNSARKPFFQCWKYSKGLCHTSHFIAAKTIEQLTVDGLKNALLPNDLRFQTAPPKQNDVNRELELLKEQRNRAAKKAIRIRDAYENGIDTLKEYKEHKLRIEKERSLLEEKIASLSCAPDSRPQHTGQKQIQTLESALTDLSHPETDGEEKGAVIRSIVDKIVYDKTAGRLDFYFSLKKR